MQTITDQGAATALATAVLRCDREAWDAVIPDLPPIAAMLAGAADLLAAVLTNVITEAGLPGDDIDIRHVWDGDWPAWAVAQMHLDPDASATAMHWLHAWVAGGERWLPGHDACTCLAVAVVLAAWLWGDRPGWAAFLTGRVVADA
jgi:hypothetical protein